MTRLLFSLSLAMLPLAFPPQLSAAPITVVNSRFEDVTGETIQSEFTFGPLNGWEIYDPDGITGGGEGGTYFIGTLQPQLDGDTADPDDYINFTDGAPEGTRVGIAF